MSKKIGRWGLILAAGAALTALSSAAPAFDPGINQPGVRGGPPASGRPGSASGTPASTSPAPPEMLAGTPASTSPAPPETLAGTPASTSPALPETLAAWRGARCAVEDAAGARAEPRALMDRHGRTALTGTAGKDPVAAAKSEAPIFQGFRIGPAV